MRLFRLFFLVCVCFVSAASGQQPSEDIMALLQFKKGIKHDPTGFVLDSWSDKSSLSSWNGIRCNGSNVVEVALDHLGLVADVDLSVLTNLTMLVKLSMSNNSISGELPLALGDFKRLQHLNISDNLFSSSLPSEIGKLATLKYLSLAGNNFSGSIPDTISGLASIQSLDMSRNSLSGPIPTALTGLGSLVYLNLSINGFTEGLPKGLELMENLEVLDLHGNMLDGQFDLKMLPTAASHVDLSHNRFNGSLIGEGQDFASFKVFDLSYNQMSGDLPAFDFVYTLEVLRLSNNRFSGSIPDNLLRGDTLVLTELDLSGNNLSGQVPTITSKTLHTLNLSSNLIAGELPPQTGSCAVIDLSRNQIEGNLTLMLQWEKVEIVDLSQNRLSGSIPKVTGQFLRLNSLNLSHNSLNASLPEGVPVFPKLTTLDLSFNQLEGQLLSTILASSTLQELYLQGNKLSGSFVIDLSRLNSNLQVLDLSDNKFSGSLPDEFGSLIELQVVNIEGNNFSGSLPDSISNMSALNALDIARNHFTGPLPKNFSDSLQAFNASYNDLSGVVPENLRKFPRSSFYPGNSRLELPSPPGPAINPSSNGCKKFRRNLIKIVIIVASVFVAIMLILLTIFIYYKRTSRKTLPTVTSKDATREASTNPSGFGRNNGGAGTGISAKDIIAAQKESSSEIISPDEKKAEITGFSPSKTSRLSWSPESGDSYTAESFPRLDVRSPDPLSGDLYFLDDTVSFTAEELSRAPAEVLGRSSHGTSYKATLESGLLLTVKWLREGIAKERKEFAKEAKKFANVRHPNVVGLRGYYWGPTQHEKLILSDYISPGNLAGFLYDRPGRRTPPLTWFQRLKIAVDVARGLNYLHFDRAVPHGNLKATNVLLDGPDLNGKVGDYCLHRLMIQSGTMEQILDAGVLGYRAPELTASKKPVPTFKSDIYAFGVILLELLTGKCAGDVVRGEDEGMDLTKWVRFWVAEGQGSDCFDPALAAEMSSTPTVRRGMNEVLGVALGCIRPVSERPGIKAVYEDLSAI